jgi:hypothetical protein
MRLPLKYTSSAITLLGVSLRITVFGSNSPIAKFRKIVNEYSDFIDIYHDLPNKIRSYILDMEYLSKT